MRCLPLVALGFVAAALPAQLLSGTIGITGFSTSQFSLLDPTGTVSAVNVGNFGGSGPATTQSIVWSPTIPNDIVIGGFGFIGRVSSAGGAPAYSVLTTAVGEVSQLSVSPAGDLIVADGMTSQVYAVNPVTGAITSIAAGPQPWGTSVNAGASDPVTGDIFVGNNGSIYRIPFGSSTPTLFTTGWSASTSYVSGIAFDPLSTDVVATLLSVNRVVRIDRATGVMTDLVPPASITGTNSITVDVNGDFIVGAGGGAVYRVPNAGGSSTLLGSTTGQGSSASGVAVIGSGGGQPTFSLGVTPSAGAATLTLTGVPPTTTEGWTLLSFNVVAPVGTGPVLGGTPDQTTLLLVQTFPVASPGNIVHWTWPVTGLWPSVPFTIPAGALPTGTLMDFVAVALDGSLNVVGATPVVRTSL